MASLNDLTRAAKKALGQASGLAAANRDKIGDAIDKAGGFVDAKTHGKYTSQISKAKSAAGKGVDYVAKQQPEQTGTGWPNGPASEPTKGAPVPPVDTTRQFPQDPTVPPRA